METERESERESDEEGALAGFFRDQAWPTPKLRSVPTNTR